MATGLLDTRALGALKKFSGKAEDWTLWEFQAASYFAILPKPVGMVAEVDDILTAAITAPIAHLDTAQFGPHALELSATVFHVLVQCTEGKALAIARRAPRRNGLMLWRMLHDDYAPNIGGRTTSILIGLLAPDFERACVDQPFLDVLGEWEARVDQYEREAGDLIASSTRIAVLARWAPEAMKVVIRNAIPSVGNDYERLRTVLHSYAMSSTEFDSTGSALFVKKPSGRGGGPQPMEIGVLNTKGGKRRRRKVRRQVRRQRRQGRQRRQVWRKRVWRFQRQERWWKRRPACGKNLRRRPNRREGRVLRRRVQLLRNMGASSF